MNRRQFVKICTYSSASVFAGGLLASCLDRSKAKQQPNIVLIYADDLGYGDLSCYGATRVHTPNIDSLARKGIRFTQAHATAATCTPSRYSLLTGEYAWRGQGTGVASGQAPLIIPEAMPTLPDMLKKVGYTNAVVGKWHLGLGKGHPDWNGELKPGPLELGFDYCFLIPATGDRVPCVYVENHRVYNLDPADPISVSYQEPIGSDPTGRSHPELLKVPADPQHSNTIVNGVSRIGYLSGGNAARWVDEEMADTLTAKAIAFIESSFKKPFFLYFSLHDIHVPRLPNERFTGKTGMGPRGDAIVQTDWCVGEIFKVLERLDVEKETLVIFTSDNGPVLNDGYADQAVELAGDHKMAGPLRGGKYSSFEGGTRIPFIVHWPQAIKPGTSAALISQVDLFATFTALTRQTLAPEEAPDSKDVLLALMGKQDQGREHLVQEAIGQHLSIRTPEWKYIVPSAGEKIIANKGIETGRDSKPQLYHLQSDPGEQNNLAEQNPEVRSKMENLLAQIKKTGDRHL